MSIGIIAAHDVIGGGSSSFSSLVLGHSPLAYWRLDEASGTTLADATGNSRSMTMSGSGWTFGGAAAGPTMGGTSIAWTTSGNASTANATWADGLTALTVGWWGKKASGTGPGLIGPARDNFSNATTSATRSFVTYLGGDNKPVFQIYTAGTGRNVTGTAITDSAWHFFVGTWDGTTSRLYVDASSVGSVAAPGTLNSGGGNGVTAATIVGATNSAGSLDELFVCSTALSGADISALFAAA